MAKSREVGKGRGKKGKEEGRKEGWAVGHKLQIIKKSGSYFILV